ncbi:response regulator transcription factor, partial [Nocardia gipuzkoensis]
SDRPRLTATELTVLEQLPSGRTVQQIAEILGVSINTVKTHLRGIYAKLGASSRSGALDLARRSGLL